VLEKIGAGGKLNAVRGEKGLAERVVNLLWLSGGWRAGTLPALQCIFPAAGVVIVGFPGRRCEE